MKFVYRYDFFFSFFFSCFFFLTHLSISMHQLGQLAIGNFSGLHKVNFNCHRYNIKSKFDLCHVTRRFDHASALID